MVLLSAAIFSKDGKVILSRQFVEMTRSRIEGLLGAFPKLVGTAGKQHTFIETESVRYVYQRLEKLYVLLLTTKASNILEDLETLRLFTKVIPEYSRSLDECDIGENIFEIIFAFDEIVALGYRENVNLAQIKTIIEMDSHDEKVFMAVRENQERGAIEKMKMKVRELQAKRDNDAKGDYYRTSTSNTGFGNLSDFSKTYPTQTITNTAAEKTVALSKPAVKSKVSSGKTMRLGSKSHVTDVFVDQLKAEGVTIEQCEGPAQSTNQTTAHENVHIRIEEKLKIESSHNSGLGNMELMGMLILKISNKESNMVRLKIDLGDAIQLQTHPNVDKKMFQTSHMLQSKSLEKAFPVGQDIGLLKWRYQGQDNDLVPLLINCWPNKTSTGCSVNVEYELQNTNLELRDVEVSISLPAGAGTPVIREVTGEYSIDARKRRLLWTLPIVDVNNSTGSMEFETRAAQMDDFFPLAVNFHSDKTFTGLRMVDVYDESGNGVKFSSETIFAVDKYEII